MRSAISCSEPQRRPPGVPALRLRAGDRAPHARAGRTAAATAAGLSRRPLPLRDRGDMPRVRALVRTQSRAVSCEEVRRLLAIAVFSLAATGSTLAGAGLVVAPHIDPPGTPAFHD